ncbi:MAG: flagellin lysine-N-methylase [Anaerovibrio sp.]
MITIVPDFYDQFSCKAGSCQHTCCQGWEIGIDEPTLYRYEKIKGEIGDKIRQSIIIRDGIFIFQLTDDDRCPLLQDDGLCQIIRTLGPKKLCKVCAMHPRFFVYTDELELAGLGLCCEKTCELLLERDTPLRFCIEGTDETMDFFELLKMTDIAKYLPRDCASQAMSILHATSSLTVSQILRIMELTEPINDSWCQLLAKIRQEATAGKLTLPPLETWPHDQQQAYDRICQYILYRRLPRLRRWHFDHLADYAKMNTTFIYLAAAVTGDLPESLRLWSAQIEYDTDNVEIILENMLK